MNHKSISMKKNIFYLFLIVSSYVQAQQYVALDIDVDRGREKDVKLLFDNYIKKHGTNGMSILIFRNQIRDQTLGSHTIVWIGTMDQVNDGLSGKNDKGNDTDLLWKSLWELSTFRQNYTGEIIAADGDPTSNENQDYQIVYGITPKYRSKFIASWNNMMKKIKVKGARHLIATPTLNRTYGSSIIGVNIGADYKSTLESLDKLYESGEWPKLWEESGGWDINISFSRIVIARY